MHRCGLLLFGYSHVAHPSFDETASGVLACDLLDGQIRAPLFIYQYEARSGDGLIEGFLLAPFFKLFGRSLFSLKMLALFSALLSLLCWIIVIKRYHGMWTALIFTALFAFPPPMFARLNLMGTIASHHLINPLIPIQLLFLLLIVEYSGKKRTPWLLLGFGFLSGLGSYAFYTYIIFNIFCLLFLLIFKSRTITFRRVLLFLVGFFAGFLPWFLRSFSSSAGGSYLASILKSIRADEWDFIQNFLFNIPHSFGYH
jgi:4-amino-4-deoxy-L-arabinose transferase-like glycosyltransferase